MTQIRIFVSDDHIDLQEQINKLLSEHPCSNVRFLQLIGNGGETTYAVLVAWEE